MGEVSEHEALSDEQIQKKGRHRKKQLYNSILQQMEFYFSDSNLNKDRFLRQQLQEKTYVDLDVFLKFNKLRKLTANIEDIQKAIKNSKLIELAEDKNSVRRRTPLKEKFNVDDCTVYVEKIKSDATHEWISSVFSEFGNVVYVSLPKYKHNNTNKGFAFVEFELEKEAQNALNYFETIGCKMPSDTEPCSIVTFGTNTEEKIETEEITVETVSKKRKFGEIEHDCEQEKKEKKFKLESEETYEADDTENKKKKKQKKEHRKKNYIKELGLQILSKKEWKAMRNRYLNLQRKKMQEFKQHLYKAKFSQNNYEDKFKKPIENGEKNKTEANAEVPEKVEFVEGVIVKIKLIEPCFDVKKIKSEIKSSSNDIKYVDIPNIGCEIVHVRFNNNNSAKDFCSQDGAGNKTLLEGDEEKVYWDKIFENRQNKFKKENRKRRGRDRLLKKANQVMAKHVKFDE